MPSDFYVATAAMHPFHFAAIFLIFVGGFLPAAKGDVRKFGTCSFYKQEAVACCVIGELLICVYNALLHACTFKREDQAASVPTLLRRVAGGQRAGLPGSDTLHTVLLPYKACRRCGRRYVLIAFLGECLSVIGVAVVMLSRVLPRAGGRQCGRGRRPTITELIICRITTRILRVRRP